MFERIATWVFYSDTFFSLKLKYKYVLRLESVFNVFVPTIYLEHKIFRVCCFLSANYKAK